MDVMSLSSPYNSLNDASAAHSSRPDVVWLPPSLASSNISSSECAVRSLSLTFIAGEEVMTPGTGGVGCSFDQLHRQGVQLEQVFDMSVFCGW